MHSGHKKEVKSCLRTAGGGEYSFLCSLAVVCLVFTSETDLFSQKCSRRGVKKINDWLI